MVAFLRPDDRNDNCRNVKKVGPCGCHPQMHRCEVCNILHYSALLMQNVAETCRGLVGHLDLPDMRRSRHAD